LFHARLIHMDCMESKEAGSLNEDLISAWAVCGETRMHGS
jgi:hypothetical protein